METTGRMTRSSMDEASFIEQLIVHEGFELMPYTDTVGKVTIGVGRNLTDRGISEDEALYLLKNDISLHKEELERSFPIVKSLDSVRYYVLLDMAFNMGIPRLQKFRRMWVYIQTSDYDKAAIEMLDSKWATQVGRRAKNLSEQMRTGKYGSN